MAGAPGKQLIVKATTNLHGENSTVCTQMYEMASDPLKVPIFTPIIDFPSGTRWFFTVYMITAESRVLVISIHLHITALFS